MKLSGNPRAVVSWYCYISNGHFEFYFTSLMLKRLMFVIPSLLFNDFIMTQVPYLTWILDLHFNITEGSFKDTFTLVFFWFWSSVSKIGSKKQTFTHFSADFFYWSPPKLWRGLSLKSQVCRVTTKKVMSCDIFTFRGRWRPQSASEVIQLYVPE